MKQSISRCLDILADNRWPRWSRQMQHTTGDTLTDDQRCRLGRIVCKALHRMSEVDRYSEHGDCMAGPGDIIAALYHWGHDHSGGQWSDTYALGCAAGQIYSPGCGGLEPDSMETMLYLDWTHGEACSLMRVCSDCHHYAHMSDTTWLDGVYLASETADVLEFLQDAFKPWEGHSKQHEQLLDVDHSIDPCELCADPSHGERFGLVLS